MDVERFNFDLPEDRIALRPAQPRDRAKLLHVRGQNLQDFSAVDLPDLLQSGDVLVLNDTKVLPAALKGVRPARPQGGGGDVTLDFNLLKELSSNRWQAFVRPAKRVRMQDKIRFAPDLNATVISKGAGGEVELEFNQSDAALMAALQKIGQPPLPPYIARKRPVDARDIPDYQTVFARDLGSVAAPTAGLHFTPALLKSLEKRGIHIAKVTLHVGAGTFLPVTSTDTADHKMHFEWFSIGQRAVDIINGAKRNGGRVIAVGTTSLRALESATDARGQVLPKTMDTDIFITPGYKFKIIDGLMTNFHLPKSTLFMLVSALAGLEVMQNAYKYAIEQEYRFYSYGDSSLIWRQD